MCWTENVVGVLEMKPEMPDCDGLDKFRGATVSLWAEGGWGLPLMLKTGCGFLQNHTKKVPNIITECLTVRWVELHFQNVTTRWQCRAQFWCRLSEQCTERENRKDGVKWKFFHSS